jgi:hypothetical protein
MLRACPLFLSIALACGDSAPEPLGPADDASDPDDTSDPGGDADGDQDGSQDDTGEADEVADDSDASPDDADEADDGADADDADTGDGTVLDDELLAAQAAPPIRASSVLGSFEAYGLPPVSFATMHADGTASPGHVELMHDFAASIGMDREEDCDHCHVDWEDEALRINGTTRIARHMWDDILGQLELASGEPFFCDSCHQGKPLFLDREDPAAVMAWMRVNMVGKLVRRDGQPNDCVTCHGEPPGVYDGLLALWAEP